MDPLLAVYNPMSGSAEDDSRERALDVLRAVTEVTVVATRDGTELQQVLTDHRERHVVVLGGDGSVHAVVNVLHRLGQLDGRRLGLIPLGTGNDLARGLDIPLDPTAAAQVVVTGRSRAIDLLVDDEGDVVVNAVHLGIGALGAEQAKPLKPRLGRIGYAVGAVVSGLRTSGWRQRVVVDGHVVTRDRGRVLMIAVCNGWSIGGHTEIAPSAVPDDGEVDVVVSHATALPARFAYAALLRLGRHVERHDVTATRGREVRISGEPVPVNADGELGERVTERTWTVHPGGLHLTVPR